MRSEAAPSHWLTVRVTGGAEHARAALIEALVHAGGACVQEQSDRYLSYVPEQADLSALRAAARAAGAAVECERAPAELMTRAWIPAVGVNRAGRFAISPPWLAAEAARSGEPILIEPAMAFGTGEHPTTRGVLRLMQEVVRLGDTVADLGAGSAVLAIAAARLGASRIAAIESDPDAIANAEENVRRNEVADRVTVLEGEAELLLPLVAPIRVVLANIVSSALIAMLPLIRNALVPDGRAILGGILVNERDAFLEAARPLGWRLESEDAEEAWWSCVVAPR